MAQSINAPLIMSQARDMRRDIFELQVQIDKHAMTRDNAIRPHLAKFEAATSGLQEEVEAKRAALESHCVKYRNVLFASEKSIKTPYGAFGFRLGGEKLMLTDDEKTVIASIKKSAKKFVDAWIRVTESISKTAVKKSIADGEMKKEKLADLGMTIEQEESFFIN